MRQQEVFILYQNEVESNTDELNNILRNGWRIASVHPLSQNPVQLSQQHRYPMYPETWTLIVIEYAG